MAEWLYEDGIGESRAALVNHGVIIEAQVELPGLRAGTIADARLTSILVPGRRGIATLSDGTDVLIEPLPKATEGAVIRIEVTREAIPEPGALKRAKGRHVDAEIRAGNKLADRIGACCDVTRHGHDPLEDAGWSELLEEAESGVVRFDGGTLRIALTPAMTLIDVDGDDALSGAVAAARAIRRFGIAGNIGIDLPTVAGKAERQAIAEAFDGALPLPFERTSVNGFGFLQVIRPRVRASLCETLRQDPAAAAARALIRRVQRSRVIGPCEIIASPSVIAAIGSRPDWIERLSNEIGGPLSLRSSA